MSEERHATESRSRIFASIIYAAAAVAINARFVIIRQIFAPGMSDRWGFVIPIVGLAIFFASFTRLLLDPSTLRQQRLAVVIANACVLGGAAYVIVANQAIFADVPFDDILGSYIVPALFVIAACLIWLRSRFAFLAGSLTTLLSWPTLAWLVLTQGVSSARLDFFSCVAGSLVLIAAAFVIPRRRLPGDLLALIATAMAWPYFVMSERSYLYSANAWNLLNSTSREAVAYGKINVIAILLLLVATVCAVVRMFPAGWSLREIPLRDRVSPIFAVSLPLAAFWFVTNAWPYHVPEPHHGLSAELSLLHVKKRGLHSWETQISFFRDSKTYVARTERKPLHYHARGTYHSVSLSAESLSRAREFYAHSREISAQPRTSPRKWNSDSWYLYLDGNLYSIFTDADNTTPPEDLVRWFEETEKLPPLSAASPTVINDVCLGFCYDPARR